MHEVTGSVRQQWQAVHCKSSSKPVNNQFYNEQYSVCAIIQDLKGHSESYNHTSPRYFGERRIENV